MIATKHITKSERRNIKYALTKARVLCTANRRGSSFKLKQHRKNFGKVIEYTKWWCLRFDTVLIYYRSSGPKMHFFSPVGSSRRYICNVSHQGKLVYNLYCQVLVPRSPNCKTVLLLCMYCAELRIR